LEFQDIEAINGKVRIKLEEIQSKILRLKGKRNSSINGYGNEIYCSCKCLTQNINKEQNSFSKNLDENFIPN
jgi:hypothetical protein